MKLTQEQIIKSFEELYLVEKTARDYYGNLIFEGLSNNEKQVISEIHHDEENHMQIVNEILDLLKKEGL